MLRLAAVTIAGFLAFSTAPAQSAQVTADLPVTEYVVRNTADRGAGSLRQAMIDARHTGGAARIRFDSVEGPFGEPQVIRLRTALPPIATRLEIDGYIPDRAWRPSGVTLRSAGKDRVLVVEAGAAVALRHLTLQGGRAQQGGAVLNRGSLVIDSSTLLDSAAGGDGGAVLNDGGVLVVINSTFTANAAARGGAVASTAGRLSVTNSTFAGNRAGEGASLFSQGTLLLRNAILANGTGSAECVNRGSLDLASTHNLMTSSQGCGRPLLTDDPRLGPLGHYNGPTPTLPLHAASQAVNVGSNAAALDESGRPLQWDQRGNGDPRDAAGITDLGAFEVQSPTALRVDRADDVDRRACSQLAGDCSLRGAWHLANAGRLEPVIRFDADAKLQDSVIQLLDPLPPAEVELLIDGSGVTGLRLKLSDCRSLSRQPARVTVTAIELMGPDGRCPVAMRPGT